MDLVTTTRAVVAAHPVRVAEWQTR
ncbi:hypothetical protein SCOCK_40180 [Actinacidiphila cocklensis]|uniref:Uncharacterized protein n=1 Tax=Actinacidiphila cocklensis TaxID=887465 RepID=A0A9W4DU33_9ACTN|nr:hypothetical protein SCOCK_40180 [Actinacidiphila cocklensis]